MATHTAKIFALFLLATLTYASFAKDVTESLPNALPGGAIFMKQHPNLDQNKDGILTYEQREIYCIETISKQLGGNYTFKREMIPMRDGVKLATGIFIPTNAGPAPAVLCRTAYGIWGVAFHNAHRFTDQKTRLHMPRPKR